MKSLHSSATWRVFSVASVAIFLVSIDTTLLFAAFNTLRVEFSESTASDMSWVLNAYTIVYAALLVPAGRFVDVFGRKRIFMLGLSLFLLASLLCGLAPNIESLIATRVLQAIGAALITPSSLALVLGAFPVEKRAVGVSLWGAVGALAAALGPSIGASVVDILGWSWAFFINLPLGTIALWLGRDTLTEWRNSETRVPFDAIGVLLLILGIGSVAYGIVQSEHAHWLSLAVLAPVISGAFILSIFYMWSRRIAHPALDLSLFADPSYRFVNLATVTFGTAFSMMFFSYFLFLIEVWKYPLPLAGIAVTPGPLLVVPVAIITGRIAARIGHRLILCVGSALYAAGGLWFYLKVGATPNYLGAWLPGLIFTGLAIGMILPSLSAAAVAKLPANRFGIGSAVNQAVRQISSVLGVSITVVVVVGGIAPQLIDFKHLYLTHIALSLVTGLLCLGIDTHPKKATMQIDSTAS